MTERRDGDIFFGRCGTETCDGTHICIKIGEEGKPALAFHNTDAAGAWAIAAILCGLAAEAEAAAGVSVLQ